MFNYHQYEKKLQIKNQIDKMREDYILDQNRRKKKNKIMSNQYKKRVENFIMSMIDNPVKSTQHINKTYQFRYDQPEKFLAGPIFIVKGFKHEKDRINEAIEKYKNLDKDSIITYKHQFRDRDINKEIQPDMHFTDKTTLERIEAYLQEHTQTQVQNETFRKITKKKKQINIEEYEAANLWNKRAIMAREIAKTLLPELHIKTHFFATADIGNSLPLSIVEQNMLKKKTQKKTQKIDSKKEQKKNTLQKLGQLQRKTTTKLSLVKNAEQSIDDLSPIKRKESFLPNIKGTKQSFDDDMSPSGKNRNEQIEAFNPKQAAISILKNCNIIREKNPKVPELKSGEGHLISYPEKSVREVYDELFKNSKTFKL